MEPTSSFELTEQGKTGDQDAFAKLFGKYERRLAVLIYYKLGAELRQSAEVDDLLQETFLRAFRDIERFQYQSPGAFLRWLASIAGHVVADAARAKGRTFRAGEATPGREPVDSKTPSRVLAQNLAVERLLERLNSLPEDYRQVILMAKMEGLSTVEMAERLGRSRESVALLLHRALKRYRALLDADAGPTRR